MDLTNVLRRNAPVRVDWIDDTVTILTFALHHSDVVGLVDDGSLRRWRRMDSGWCEISRSKSTAGQESFRLWSYRGEGHGAAHATTQLGYNNAIAVCETSIYFGVGQVLQHLVRNPTVQDLMRE